MLYAASVTRAWTAYALSSASMEPPSTSATASWPSAISMKTTRPGDLAVFRPPRDRGTDCIKCIVGTLGDRVQPRGGVLYINGVALERRRGGGNHGEDARGTLRAEYAEIMAGGCQYRILTGDQPSPMVDTAELVVPPAHYYVLGRQSRQFFGQPRPRLRPCRR
jgi:signal peptidase I